MGFSLAKNGVLNRMDGEQDEKKRQWNNLKLSISLEQLHEIIDNAYLSGLNENEEAKIANQAIYQAWRANVDLPNLLKKVYGFIFTEEASSQQAQQNRQPFVDALHKEIKSANNYNKKMSDWSTARKVCFGFILSGFFFGCIPPVSLVGFSLLIIGLVAWIATNKYFGRSQKQSSNIPPLQKSEVSKQETRIVENEVRGKKKVKAPVLSQLDSEKDAQTVLEKVISEAYVAYSNSNTSSVSETYRFLSRAAQENFLLGAYTLLNFLDNNLPVNNNSVPTPIQKFATVLSNKLEEKGLNQATLREMYEQQQQATMATLKQPKARAAASSEPVRFRRVFLEKDKILEKDKNSELTPVEVKVYGDTEMLCMQ